MNCLVFLLMIIAMIDGTQSQSLFMNAFRKIHERLHNDNLNSKEGIRDKGNSHGISQPQSYMDFLTMIPWTEGWMIALISLHILCFVVILMTRNRWNTQYVIFFFLLASVLFSENINNQAALRWRLFTKENYFDSNGLFISTVWSTPILINCIVLIAMWLYEASKSIVQIKRKELIDRNNTESKKKK